MEAVVQAVLVLSVFSAIHERVVEMVRGLLTMANVRELWRDRLTIGAANPLLAIGLAAGTHANLLALFQRTGPGETLRFFAEYPAWRPGEDLVGCVLMGLATTLGSQFWHDLGRGLVDVRNRVKGVRAEAARSAEPPPP